MRIEELWLDAYGPFTNVRIPLSPDRLNVVFGPNEAGKSTSLRAIEALLFEHEVKTQDAHVHAMPKLRVGGVLTTKGGVRFPFVRRKGKTQTVLDPVSGEPIDDALLAGMLGGVTREAFRAVYGLDHVRLADGGRALAAGKGLVGESLFAASMGIVHLHRLHEALDEEASSIYKPRGKQQLNAEVEACDKARREADFGATSAETVANDRAELEKRGSERAELKERKRICEAEKARLVRVRNVRPPLMELRAVLEMLRVRGDPRTVDPKARDDAERALAIAGPAVERIEAELGTAKNDRAEVPLDMRVLAYKDEIQALWTERGAHVKAIADRAGLETQLAPLGKKLTELLGASSVDVAAVDAAIQRAKGAGTREAQIAASEEELGELVESTRADLEALGLEPDMGAALRLVVPSEEAIDEAERAEEPNQTRIDELARAIAQREQQIRELDDEIADLRATKEVPTEEELRAAREKRDAIVDALASQKGKLGDAVRAVANADRVVDRMRADATTVSTLALRQRELEAAEKARVRDEAALEAATKEHARLRKGWERVWSALGARVGSPKEMRAWHRRFSEARDACADAEQRRRKLETDRSALKKTRVDLEHVSKPLGIAAESIAELLERLREHHRRLERTELTRAKEIESTREKIDDLKNRIEGIDRDATVLRTRVASLVRSVAPSLDWEKPIDTLVAIHDLWMDAEKHRMLAERLDARIAALETDLKGDRARIAEAKAALDRLLAVSGASSIPELRRFEEEAREIEALRASRTRLDADLARLGDGQSIASLEAEAAQVTSIEEARARIDELDLMLEQTNAELEQVTRQVHNYEEGMKRYEQPLALAAEASARSEEHLARARELALRYVRLELASGVLSRAIERLRDKSQGPVLSRASSIFKAITLGNFEKLTVDLGEDDQPVLTGVRADGRETGVLGMSDGTRDQLYLALRIASLERLADSGDPLPLVLDDVLMSFDDDRARASLRVLAELAHRMQVLLFTHHERTAQLAREAVADLALHELPPQTAVSAA